MGNYITLIWLPSSVSLLNLFTFTNSCRRVNNIAGSYRIYIYNVCTYINILIYIDNICTYIIIQYIYICKPKLEWRVFTFTATGQCRRLFGLETPGLNQPQLERQPAIMGKWFAQNGMYTLLDPFRTIKFQCVRSNCSKHVQTNPNISGHFSVYVQICTYTYT